MPDIAEIEEMACGGSIYDFADNCRVYIHNDGQGTWDLLNAEGAYVSDTDDSITPYWQAIQTHLGA